MTSKFYVELCVYDYEVAHEEITQALGLSPNRTETKGDKKNVGPGMDITIEQNGWFLESQIDTEEALEKHVGHLLGRTKDQAEAFRELSKKFMIQLSIVAYHDYANLGLQINKDQVVQLASMGITLDFDLYCLTDNAN